MTDRNVIKLALQLAILEEESLIEAYRGEYSRKINEEEPGVIDARKNVEAFKRVLKKYYGGVPKTELDKMLENAKPVNIFDLMKGKIEE